MNVVLDTNVFNNRTFLEWLRHSDLEPVTSSVVYMELLYKYARRKGLAEARSKLMAVFNSLAIEVMDFDWECAELAVESALGRWDFSKNARDYMIGSLALKLNAPLVTYNKKHFSWLPEVLTPEDVMERFGK
ncbi:type II toxin-antitoxin system VapC family toxin [Thermococcus sp. 21S9]|uniref:type II toxin-antitoxin system VapC family toxin n=1 Tax=Thermococcus sp. 21S9 TaxID=1638223 RepID=UPI00143AD536|nr:PIN domain-containing protein [Thermococcus sp. 21S9]NJE53666.1 type II toxin-antitoxin system VapC family toxin [Thermococcus sp. 21S9]